MIKTVFRSLSKLCPLSSKLDITKIDWGNEVVVLKQTSPWEIITIHGYESYNGGSYQATKSMPFNTTEQITLKKDEVNLNGATVVPSIYTYPGSTNKFIEIDKESTKARFKELGYNPEYIEDLSDMSTRVNRIMLNNSKEYSMSESDKYFKVLYKADNLGVKNIESKLSLFMSKANKNERL